MRVTMLLTILRTSSRRIQSQVATELELLFLPFLSSEPLLDSVSGLSCKHRASFGRYKGPGNCMIRNQPMGKKLSINLHSLSKNHSLAYQGHLIIRDPYRCLGTSNPLVA